MTIKKLLILMLLSYFFCFFLLLTVFSADGFMAISSMKQYYQELQKQQELYEIKLESLKKHKERSCDIEALSDVAFSLGYKKEGEKVFYFDEPDVLDDVVEDNGNDGLPKRFTGIKTAYLALYALIAPALLLVYYFIRKLVASPSSKDNSHFTGGSFDYYGL